MSPKCEWFINDKLPMTEQEGHIFVEYRTAGKFGEFDKSSMICQTKTIQISTYN